MVRTEISELSKSQIYYKKNKDKILLDMKKKITCEHCNRTINKATLLRHQRSIYCMSKQSFIDLDD
tara:strand:- start:297 stop:494 length:198 start_codon:yes stop_codon:yes gene_type:complete